MRRPPPPSALVLDWGGVFVHRPHGSARRALERRLGLEPGGLGAFFKEDDWIRLSTGRLGEAEFWNRVCDSFPVRPNAVLARRVWDHLFEDVPRRRVMLELLDRLRGRVRLGLLSNAGPGLRAHLDPLLGHFDDVVISAEVGCRKPEPEIFKLALRRLGAAPPETLFVDDFAHNCAAARELGIRTHRFTTPGRLLTRLEREGLLEPAQAVYSCPA